MTTTADIWMTPTDRAPELASPASGPSGETLRLFSEHGPSLYRFCRFTLGRADDAEDVVQESFLKLLQHLAAGGDRSNLRAWLFTVAANGCRDRLRRRTRWLPWRAELDDRTVAPPDASVDARDALAVIQDLPARDRLLLSLRAQGLSYREIAAAAVLQEASVGRLLARAVDRWKRAVSARRPSHS